MAVRTSLAISCQGLSLGRLTFLRQLRLNCLDVGATWVYNFLGIHVCFVRRGGHVCRRGGIGLHNHESVCEAAVDFELRRLPGIWEIPRQVRGIRPSPARIEVEPSLKTLQ